MKIFKYTIAVAALLTAMACNGKRTAPATQEKSNKETTRQIDTKKKTLIPFTTHEGSGLGNCVKDVKDAYPKANVVEGFAMYGHDVRTGQARVEKWLKKLGYQGK